jgi:hypothetical protein
MGNLQDYRDNDEIAHRKVAKFPNSQDNEQIAHI